jgi:hypothetical protein
MANRKSTQTGLLKEDSELEFQDMGEDDDLRYFDKELYSLPECSSVHSDKFQKESELNPYIHPCRRADESPKARPCRVQKNRSAYNLFIKDRVRISLT